MIDTERMFSKACQSRGFARLAPRFYARCIGDGIYQTIYTGFKAYIDVDSPHYSPEHRKSYYIGIGIRSLYARHEEELFVPGKDAGEYAPLELCLKRKASGPFHGIETEYGLMSDSGFDVLDSVDTQEKFLELWDAVRVSDYGQRLHSLVLVGPLLLCGKQYDAEYEITASFISGMDAYMCYRDRVNSGMMERLPFYEQRIWDGAEEKLRLWHWCIGRNYQELNKYIHDNYSRNMAWVRQYGIPTDMLTPERTLENL